MACPGRKRTVLAKEIFSHYKKEDMEKQNAYMVIDIGTGNVRVAITRTNGDVINVERDNVHYEKDDNYPEALYFDPDRLWEQITALAQKVLRNTPDVAVKAITASSQREGVVLLGKSGESLTGLPNHDHRGREYENLITRKDYVYRLTGRYPSSLFSALKLIGLKNKRPETYERVMTLVSISDWAQYQLSGVAAYEHSQASETLLYDVAEKQWSPALCNIFGISENILPDLVSSGTVLGNILPEYAHKWNLSPETVVVTGGADTQLAIKSTRPATDDVVIVSGTTTPVVKIAETYSPDEKMRTWTNRHVEEGQFILEANAGVTGLNYQRLKEIFYPNEGYEVIEKELAGLPPGQCVASLGSLVAEEKSPLTSGGFLFDVPVSHQLSRACFVWATLWDIACCIKENYDVLCDVSPQRQDYVWACGGGLQSRLLRQFLADLTGKKVRVRDGFEQSSVAGGALVCSEALGIRLSQQAAVAETIPQGPSDRLAFYQEWKKVRSGLKQIF